VKIIVTAGGTGGHIYPALAIIKKFQEKDRLYRSWRCSTSRYIKTRYKGTRQFRCKGVFQCDKTGKELR